MSTISFLSVKSINQEQKLGIIALWNKEYPINLKYNTVEEFDNYLSKLKDQNHLLLITEAEEIKGWYVDFIRDNDIWFAMIIDEQFQGKGIGSELLKRSKENRSTLNGWITNHDHYKKADGTAYKSPKQFYVKNGFEILEEEKLETEKLSAVKIRWKRS